MDSELFFRIVFGVAIVIMAGSIFHAVYMFLVRLRKSLRRLSEAKEKKGK